MIKVDNILSKLQVTPKYENLTFEDLISYLDKVEVRIIRCKIKGYKNIEIAKKLKVCPATITNRIVKIRKKLRGYLKNEFRKKAGRKKKKS